MIILDTDHISVLQHRRSPQAACLTRRLSMSPDRDILTTVVTVDEQMRGWLAMINRRADVRDQMPYYDRLIGLLGFYRKWRVRRLDEDAASEFRRLREEGLRIGTMDLKIASIALANDATVLSGNLRDFAKVPGLRVENWLTP